MSKFKVALFDVDGVLIKPSKFFSETYAEKYGLDPKSFNSFFRGDFLKALTGAADLKDLIVKNHDIWQWDDDPQKILEMWFEAEDYPDKILIDIIQKYRQSSGFAYIATNQEKYRLKYLTDVTFPEKFDGIFAAHTVGYLKMQPEYWEKVIGKLKEKLPSLELSEIIYFDDRQAEVDAAVAAGVDAHLYVDNKQVQFLIEA